MTRIEPSIPGSELASLVAGSVEERLAKIGAALRSSGIFKDGHRILATYPECVKVVTPDGVSKIRIEENALGEIRIIGVEPVAVTVVTGRNLRGYLHGRVGAALDSFFGGNVVEAQRILGEILPLVSGDVAASESETLDAFAARLRGERFWRGVLESKKAQIEGILGGTVPAPLPPKFRKLYDGATSAAELEDYRGLVHEDVAHAVGRLTLAVERAEQARSQMGIVRGASTYVDGGGEALASLEAFVEDLIHDARSVLGFVSDARSEFGDLALVARMYDHFAPEVPRFETAAGFARNMAERLASAAETTTAAD